MLITIQLYLHCTEEEIEEPGTPRSRTGPSTPTAASTPLYTPLTPRTPVHRQRSLSPPSSVSSRLDANAPVFTPSFARGPSQLREEVPVETLGPREPEVVTPDAGGIYSDHDPDAGYVRLTSEMDGLRKGNNGPESTEQLCPKQIDFPRKKASEAQYRLEHERFHSEALKNKLHDLSDAIAVHPKPSEVILPSKHQSLEPKPTEATTMNVDIFDNDSDDENSGGLFEILQEVPATETTASGSTVRLQSMVVPKHWSDRLPKAILQEIIAKKDKYAIAKYTCISGPSRIMRASVTITWNGGRTQSWNMDDVGCPDLKQAEEYISTVALHALTFPTLDGFALGGTFAAGTQTFFRRLPPAFRILWDELEAQRKESDDATNRSAWEKLRMITWVKLESQSKVPFLECYLRVYFNCIAVDWEAFESCWKREGREDRTEYTSSGT